MISGAGARELSESGLEQTSFDASQYTKSLKKLEAERANLQAPIARRSRVFNWTAGITFFGTLADTIVYRISNALGYENVARIADDALFPIVLGGAAAALLCGVYNSTGRRKEENIALDALDNKLAEYYNDW